MRPAQYRWRTPHVLFDLLIVIDQGLCSLLSGGFSNGLEVCWVDFCGPLLLQHAGSRLCEVSWDLVQPFTLSVSVLHGPCLLVKLEQVALKLWDDYPVYLGPVLSGVDVWLDHNFASQHPVKGLAISCHRYCSGGEAILNLNLFTLCLRSHQKASQNIISVKFYTHF